MDYDKSIEYRLVSYNQNWSFTPIWKNGTHSIFEAFSQRFPEMHRATTGHQIHSFIFDPPESDDLKMLHKESEEYLEFVKQSFNIVCLRDPYTRFISNFYDKLVVNPDGKEAKHFFSQYNTKSADPIKKIKLFVNYVEEQQVLDPHFQTQSSLCDAKNIDYSYIINLQKINEDWSFLTNKFLNIPKLGNNKMQASHSQEFATMVARDSRLRGVYNKILMLYLDDYKLLEKFS